MSWSVSKKIKSCIHKYLLISVSLFILLSAPYLLPATNTVSAADTLTPQQAAQELCNGGTCPINSIQGIFTILRKIVQYVYIAFFFFGILFILLAAYNFLFARGEPEKIKSARTQILWAVVAIVIALISVGAAQIIQSFINVQ